MVLNILSQNCRSLLVLLLCMLLYGCSASPKKVRYISKVPTDTLSENQKRSLIIDLAKEFIGTKYSQAGKTPSGFDCSGFVIYVLGKMTYSMPASAACQATCGKTIDINEAKQGDLVFFGSPKRINHVGIISKKTDKKLLMIHSSSSRGVIEENVWESDYWSKRICFVKSLNSYKKENDLSQK
ncbi:MAG: C40 family peptidase [Bacteroidota bacterium]|nr:C40 family peptidase [Bacteroidota bacterium]